MDETTISESVKAATEGLKNSATTAASEAERQIRENGPRVVQSVQRTYDEANDYVGGFIANRQLPALLAAGALGLLIGVAMRRR